MAMKIIYEACKRKMSSNVHKLEGGDFLEYAMLSNGGSYADDLVHTVKRVVHIFPVYACFILYWLALVQVCVT